MRTYTAWLDWNKRLRDALRGRHVRIRDVAEKAGVHEQTVYSWTNKSRNINLADFFALCEAAELSPLAVLFGNTNEKDFLDLLTAWGNASEDGRNLIRLAVKGAKSEKPERGFGGAVPSE